MCLAHGNEVSLLREPGKLSAAHITSGGPAAMGNSSNVPLAYLLACRGAFDAGRVC